MPKPIHVGFASKHQFEKLKIKMKLYSTENWGRAHTVWSNIASCLMWTAITWAIGSGIAMLLVLPKIVRENDMAGMLVGIGFVALSCIPLLLGLIAQEKSYKASRSHLDAKASAKADENRKKFRLFTALAELFSLEGFDWQSPREIVVVFEGGQVKYLPQLSSIPGRNSGKTTIIPTMGQSVEVNDLNIELVPPKVLEAVEAALAEARALKTAEARDAREVLKHL